MNMENFADSKLSWPIGQTLELTCELTLDSSDLDQYALDWYLPHSQGRSTNISLQTGRSRLMINDFDVSDVGPYKCKAQGKNDKLPLIKEKQIDLFVLSKSVGGNECNPGFFQCKSKKHCILNRYLCDGFQDCTDDGSDETVELCGNEDWCSGKIRCGNEARCLDPSLCCDPEWDPDCKVLLECCKPYVESRRYYFQLGIEESEKIQRNNGAGNRHVFVIVGKALLKKPLN